MLGALALPLPPLGSLQGEGVVQGEENIIFSLCKAITTMSLG